MTLRYGSCVYTRAGLSFERMGHVVTAVVELGARKGAHAGLLQETGPRIPEHPQLRHGPAKARERAL